MTITKRGKNIMAGLNLIKGHENKNAHDNELGVGGFANVWENCHQKA